MTMPVTRPVLRSVLRPVTHSSIAVVTVATWPRAVASWWQSG